jgi:hypothetical protein
MPEDKAKRNLSSRKYRKGADGVTEENTNGCPGQCQHRQRKDGSYNQLDAGVEAMYRRILVREFVYVSVMHNFKAPVFF